MADKVIALEEDSVRSDIKKIKDSVDIIDKSLKDFRLVVSKAYGKDNIEPYKVFARKITGYVATVKSVKGYIEGMETGLKKYSKHMAKIEGCK